MEWPRARGRKATERAGTHTDRHLDGKDLLSLFAQVTADHGGHPGRVALWHLDINWKIILMSFMRTTLTVDPDVELLL